jgi:hypothetical protein
MRKKEGRRVKKSSNYIFFTQTNTELNECMGGEHELSTQHTSFRGANIYGLSYTKAKAKRQGEKEKNYESSKRIASQI